MEPEPRAREELTDEILAYQALLRRVYEAVEGGDWELIKREVLAMAAPVDAVRDDDVQWAKNYLQGNRNE